MSVEQCAGCGEDVVLRRSRAGDVLCRACSARAARAARVAKVAKVAKVADTERAATLADQTRRSDGCRGCLGFGCVSCDPSLARVVRGMLAASRGA